MSDSITFHATLPTIGGAIKFAGDGGARVQLDVDQQAEGDMVPLLLWRGMLLKVTIEPIAHGQPET